MRIVPVQVGALLPVLLWLAAPGCGDDGGREPDCEASEGFGCVASCAAEGPVVPAACADGRFACPGRMVPVASCEGIGGSGGGGTGGSGGTGGAPWCPKACRLECQGEATLLDCVRDERGCPVQVPVDCGEGRSCWERPNDTPRAFCAELGCGDDFLQPWEGCDDGEWNGTYTSDCFAWCQPRRPAVRVDGATVEDATGTVIRTVQGIGNHLRIGVRSDVEGTIARLVLREDAVFMRISATPDGAPFYTSHDSRMRVNEHTLEKSYEWHLSNVGIHAGQTLWFTAQLVDEQVLLLEGDPAPAADVDLIEGAEVDPLDPGADIRFELWIHPGPVPCHTGAAPGTNPPWTSTQPWCVASCDPPEELRQREGAICVHSLWNCPDGWVPESACR